MNGSPDAVDAVLVEDAFIGYDCQIANERLCDDNVVERVLVMSEQPPGILAIFQSDDQLSKTFLSHASLDVLSNVIRFREPSKAMLGGNLPSGCGTDEHDVVAIVNCSVSRSG